MDRCLVKKSGGSCSSRVHYETIDGGAVAAASRDGVGVGGGSGVLDRVCDLHSTWKFPGGFCKWNQVFHFRVRSGASMGSCRGGQHVPSERGTGLAPRDCGGPAQLGATQWNPPGKDEAGGAKVKDPL